MKVRELFESELSYNIKVFNSDEQKRDKIGLYTDANSVNYHFYIVSNGEFPFDLSNDKLYGDFDCNYCPSLTSLKGCPSDIKYDFLCNGCENLESLENAPKKVGRNVELDCPKITSLEGIGKDYFQEIGMGLYLHDTIKSNILGILKIKNLLHIEIDEENEDLVKAYNIIRNHLKSGRNIRKCKLELEEAGLEEYARL